MNAAFDVVEETLLRKGIKPPYTVTEPTYVTAAHILADLYNAGYDIVQRDHADPDCELCNGPFHDPTPKRF